MKKKNLKNLLLSAVDTALPAEHTVSFYFFFLSCSSFFFRGHLPETSCFRLAKQMLVVSFASQARACILSE